MISMINLRLSVFLSLLYVLESNSGFNRVFSNILLLPQSRSDTSILHKRFQTQTAFYTPDRSWRPTASPARTDTWPFCPLFSWIESTDEYRKWVGMYSILRMFVPSWWKLWDEWSRWCCSYWWGIWPNWWKERLVLSCWFAWGRVFRTRVVLRGDSDRCSGWGWRIRDISVCFASWGRL